MSTIVTPYTDHRMAEIADKVRNGVRLSLEDGVYLYETDDLLTLGQLANEVNLRKNGKKVYFIENMSLYFTNVCESHCAFCNFRKDQGEEGAYTLSGQEMIEYVEQHIHPGVREFHIVGGHNNHVPFQYYVDSLKALNERFPDVTLKAYTAAEIEFFTRISGLSTKEVLEELRKAGLKTLTGGGAEILSDQYRQKMKVDKANVDQYLDVHRTAHQLGMKTHTTMLYGAIESHEDRIRHMIQIRDLQDETGGFLVFIPLSMQPKSKNASIMRRNSAYEDLKTIAISRLMLDNFDHIKAYFINIGPQLTQVALSFGASDVHGTILKERISHAAGALTPEGLTRKELVWLIKGAGRIPVERDTFYNEIKVYE
ncbi:MULTISPECIES: aminofutalosine synthase MqnE [Paenibacillus]|uniref:Aminodeoxyfutalosine synthase n=1 Tax=Paenibacillus campinasensis TaxID=66347 RepID=A0A268EXU3_9BACL|nr:MULTISPECIES: aminofutalosine synthase MqnE [Paenibacillus]MUG66482.1 aminofutalosine synthase MqnE [Paenibacillus campinasensis]PAD77950.1 aminofutalosine synthase MqnE [Paenibacillus campinasensis]PAK52968.1 aminofutalosine synthase MqnE [Paenibacillus sp. 7541]